jgi:hypothetical protein
MGNWLTDLFAGPAVEATGKIIDNLTTSEQEKAQAKNEIAKITLDSLSGVVNAQRDVLVTEIGGSKLQRAWRPLVMLAFAFIVCFYYFIYPVVRSFKPELPVLEPLDIRFWDLLELGLGGYVIGRSVEKVAETVTRNVDLPYLKKKDRKAAVESQKETNID